MQVVVGPARRPGGMSEIYDEPLRECDLETDADGGVTLTIDALGIRCEKSRYRYRIRLTPAEASRLADALASTAGA